MYSLQPTFWWRYLRWQSVSVPVNLRRLFYLSWEDALWDILVKKNVDSGSTILVPEFFCGDVEQNMRDHGYKVAYYPVSAQLTTTDKQLTSAITKHQPAVVVILHAVGITNALWQNLAWTSKLKPETIVIEDSVHRIVDPARIKLRSPNHLVIDSLRKVVPLQGCQVYGTAQALPFAPPPLWQSAVYAAQVTLWWLVMDGLWSMTQLVAGTRLAVQLARVSESAMLAGYDVIGDQPLSAAGWPVFSFLSRHINTPRIEHAKQKQVELYESLLQNFPQEIGSALPYEPDDRGLLRHWPLRLELATAPQFLARLREQGLMVRFELNDSVWSRSHKIIYLPLGLHLAPSHIEHICQLVLRTAHEVAATPESEAQQ